VGLAEGLGACEELEISFYKMYKIWHDLQDSACESCKIL